MSRRLGRRSACLALTFGLLVTACAPSQPSPAVDPSQPGELAAAAPLVDLGRVPFDKRVDASYELLNTGGTPVALVGRAKVSMLEGC